MADIDYKDDDEVYRILTPFGGIEAYFDTEESGVRLEGSADAIAHMKDVMSQVTGTDGRILSVTACSPDDLYRFCQPEWSGIKIMPPFAVALSEHRRAAQN